MIKPMLAVPMKKGAVVNWNDWAFEQKFDGYRLIVRVTERDVTAWTRPRKHAGGEGKSMATFDLPPHLVTALKKQFARGVYDGELLAGATSTDVRRTDLNGSQRFICFDVIEVQGQFMGGQPYSLRRRILETIFHTVAVNHVELAQSVPVTCEADVKKLLAAIWKAGGEGGILKRKSATYQAGKRSPDFIKLKKVSHEVMEVVGFERGRGKVNDRGPFAMVKLRSLDGKRETTVKTLDDAELAAFEKEAGLQMSDPRLASQHPAIGRHLMIEFQDWTPKGGYRHPRWDRWEDE